MSYKMHILVCGGTGCRASASKNIICRLEDCLKERALEDEVQVIATGSVLRTAVIFFYISNEGVSLL